jgi:hypothetical protein
MNAPLQKIPSQVPGLPSVHRQRRVARSEPEEMAIRLRPGGPPEMIPVTREILLNPCPEIQILQSDDQDKGIRRLAQRLEDFVEQRPGWRIFSDVSIRWPMLSKDIAPDIAVAEAVPTKPLGQPRKILDVAKEGCRVRTVFEIVSSGRLARLKDEEWNPPHFARAGVEDLVLVYPPNLRRAGDPPLRLFSLSGKSYREHGPGAEGRYLLKSLGVSLAVEGEGVDEEIVPYDAATGERLISIKEARGLAQKASEARAAAELRATQAEEARQTVEAENQKLLAELERLRGQS